MGKEQEQPRLTSQSLKVLKIFLEAPPQALSGAEIIKAAGLASGTVYPILLRFEEHNILESEWEKGKPQALGRPRRRLYSMTGHGQTVARAALADLGVPGLLRPAFGDA
jgi:DNA-binding PadR family transcriptional regulator